MLSEESDLTERGEAVSHFELYLRAMREVSADTSQIEQFLASLRAGRSVEAALEEAGVPVCVKEFVRHTFRVVSDGQLHELAAAFTYGREKLIPDMFGELVARFESNTAAYALRNRP